MATRKIEIEGLLATGKLIDGYPEYCLTSFILACPECGSTDVNRMGWRSALISDTPIENRTPTRYWLKRPRVGCKSCLATKVIDYEHAVVGGHTDRLCDQVWRLYCEHGISGTIELSGLVRKSVRTIVDRHEDLLSTTNPPSLPKQVSILWLTLAKLDVTLVVDAETGACVDITKRASISSELSKLRSMIGANAVKRIALPLGFDAAGAQEAFPRAKIHVERASFLTPLRDAITDAMTEITGNPGVTAEIQCGGSPPISHLKQSAIIQLRDLYACLEAANDCRTERSFERFLEALKQIKIASRLRVEIKALQLQKDFVVAGLKVEPTPAAELAPRFKSACGTAGKPAGFSRHRALALFGEPNNTAMDAVKFLSLYSYQ